MLFRDEETRYKKGNWLIQGPGQGGLLVGFCPPPSCAAEPRREACMLMFELDPDMRITVDRGGGRKEVLFRQRKESRAGT